MKTRPSNISFPMLGQSISNEIRSVTTLIRTRFGAPVIMLVAIFSWLLAFSPEQAQISAGMTVKSLIQIMPFIALSVALSSMLRATGADQIVAKAFSGNPIRSILVASAFGALSPFCSCGVIPVIAGLLAAGVPIAPVIAFCIASPAIDPEMLIITVAALGLEFGTVKVISAIVMGSLAGFVTHAAAQAGLMKNALKEIASPCGAAAGGGCGPKACGSVGQPIVWAFWNDSERRRQFIRECIRAGWFLLRWLAVAFALESIMLAYVPGDMIAGSLGEGNPYAIPLATLVGIPAYLNGYAAIPLIRGLLDLGMSPATGMAFMLAGSVTSIPASIAVWTLVRPRLFTIYIAMAAAGSMLCAGGYALWLSLL